ncbi:hypothetical protein YPPY32_0931, partial [Yersinia pestis PY-32]
MLPAVHAQLCGQ